MGTPMKLRKNNQGFSAVEVLLVLVVIILLGGIGLLVHHNQKAAKVALSSTASTKAAPATTKKVTNGSSPASPFTYTSVTPRSAVSDSTDNTGSSSYSASTAPESDSDSNWLPVTEWGVEIPTISVADPNLRLPLNYEPDISAPDNSVVSVRVFQGPSSECSDGNNTVPLVFVYRDSTWADYNGQTRSADATITIAGHTYRIYEDTDSQGCIGDNSLVGQDETNLLSQVKQAIAS